MKKAIQFVFSASGIPARSIVLIRLAVGLIFFT